MYIRTYIRTYVRKCIQTNIEICSYSECHCTVFCSSRSVEVMGGSLKKIFGKKDMRILMLGLDAAGKTSIPSQSVNEFFMHNNMI